tara:strand:- start:1205 stop:1375 length:171 start_codon:yes stop_codon:yes gene_type:complete
MKIIKKFYKPFTITYILLSIALGSYPSFDFYTMKGQIIIIIVSIFNGVLGIYVKKL